MKNNNLSGEKKPEMITDKNGNVRLLNHITDLNFIENLDDNKPINHKYEGLIKLYPDEKIWLQTISTEKSL